MMPAKRKSSVKTSSTRSKKTKPSELQQNVAVEAASSSSSVPSNNTINNNTQKPIYFWKPQEPETGYLSQWYSLLPFRDRTDPAKVYPTAEHYMMHHKALLFGDPEIARLILETQSPRDVRSLGRAVKGFDQDVWARERVRIVTEGNWCKFSLPVLVDEEEEDNGAGKDDGQRQNDGKKSKEEDDDDDDGDGDGDGQLREWKLGHGDGAKSLKAASFRDVLLATGDRELVEASSFDRIWGIGFTAKGADGNRHKWGMNLLGKCLMEVREQFRKDAEAAQTAMAENSTDS
ncbi:DUF1768-domain-containing protein [Xylariaceae sp. FL0594]|nr:DUF1768-domain-containing protein [Xylariaceae sp. FL0594]